MPNTKKTGTYGHWTWTTADDGWSYTPTLTHDGVGLAAAEGPMLWVGQGPEWGHEVALYLSSDHEPVGLPITAERGWVGAAVDLALRHGVPDLVELAVALGQLSAALGAP